MRCIVVISTVIHVLGMTGLAASDTDLHILSASNSQLTFQFQPQHWQTHVIDTADGPRQLFSFWGCDFEGQPGDPHVPLKSWFVAVPEGARISARIIHSEYRSLKNIILAPHPQWVHTDKGRVLHFGESSVHWQSPPIIVVEEPHEFRGHRVCRISVHPLQYDREAREAKQFTSLSIECTFSHPFVPQPTTQMADQTVAALVLNPQHLVGRTIAPRLHKSKVNPLSGPNVYKIYIENNRPETIYKLTGASLKAAGIHIAGIDPATLQLFNNGGRQLPLNVQEAPSDTLMETPIKVNDGNDGSFDDGDDLLFYGRPLKGVEFDADTQRLRHYSHPYGDQNVYWLTFNQQQGKRIRTINVEASPDAPQMTTTRALQWLEEEKHNPFGSGMVWLGSELSSYSSTFTWSFPLNFPLTSREAAFRCALASYSSGDRFSIVVNGNLVGQCEQSGDDEYIRRGVHEFFADGVLMNGENSVTVSYQTHSDVKSAHVDWLEVEYERSLNAMENQLLFYSPSMQGEVRYSLTGFTDPHVHIFDVSDAGAIQELAYERDASGVLLFGDVVNAASPKRYIAISASAFTSVPSASTSGPVNIAGLRQPRNADYIVITHHEFQTQAERLKTLHESMMPGERLQTEIVIYDDIQTEFGWGIQDPNAICHFLNYAQTYWGNPQYVLLLGDGHFDYKNIRRTKSENFIPPYELGGLNYYDTRASDDWFTFTRGSAAGMQLAIGRLPVRSRAEAKAVVDKLVNYQTNPEVGEWQKLCLIVADDEFVVGGTLGSDYSIHTSQAERLAEQFVPDLLDVKKLYLIDYPYERTLSISGITKPQATLELIEQINRGALIVNFIGHANEEVLSHESLLLRSRDMELIQNGQRQALWIAASCEFAQWDSPDIQSFAEDLFCADGRGAVAMLASARVAYPGASHALHTRFLEYLFEPLETTGNTARLGDALMLAKRHMSDAVNSEKYILFGDPAMRLRVPPLRIYVDALQPDSIRALTKMRLTGHVEDVQGQPAAVSGQVLARVYDSRTSYTYEVTDEITMGPFLRQGNTLFRGITPLVDGTFTLQFIVPKDISYGGQDASVHLFFWNDQLTGSGSRSGVSVGGTSAELNDQQGPHMTLHFGEPNFVSGDYVDAQPTLHIELEDSLSGINTAGDIGHQIMLTFDEEYAHSRDITEYFVYKPGSYTTGTIEYPILHLPLGEHLLEVKAWDNSNNSSIVETRFVAVDRSDLRIRHLLAYPNPMQQDCTFRFELSQDAEVSLKLFTVAGRLIRAFEALPGRAGYNIFPLSWDGRDAQGDLVANGVYLYKVSAKKHYGDKLLTAENIDKVVVAR